MLGNFVKPLVTPAVNGPGTTSNPKTKGLFIGDAREVGCSLPGGNQSRKQQSAAQPFQVERRKPGKGEGGGGLARAGTQQVTSHWSFIHLGSSFSSTH